MTSTDEDIAAIAQISADSALRELGEHVPELSFLSLVARARSELTHSRIIAALFDPRRHRQAEPALRAFVSAVALELAAVEPDTRAAYERVAASVWTTVRVRRELFRIDVVVEIVSPVGSLVIGIENKIDAAEQSMQVARYQQSLSRAFPEQTAVLAFLAPQKRAPTTADASSPVPAVPIDYSSVLVAVTSALEATTPNTSDFFVLSEIAKHLREELLEDSRIRDLARQLWRDHPRALELALEHRPRLGDIRAAYEHLRTCSAAPVRRLYRQPPECRVGRATDATAAGSRDAACCPRRYRRLLSVELRSRRCLFKRRSARQWPRPEPRRGHPAPLWRIRAEDHSRTW